MLRLVLQKDVLRLVFQTEDMDYLLGLRVYLRLIELPIQLEGLNASPAMAASPATTIASRSTWPVTDREVSIVLGVISFSADGLIPTLFQISSKDEKTNGKQEKNRLFFDTRHFPT